MMRMDGAAPSGRFSTSSTYSMRAASAAWGSLGTATGSATGLVGGTCMHVCQYMLQHSTTHTATRAMVGGKAPQMTSHTTATQQRSHTNPTFFLSDERLNQDMAEGSCAGTREALSVIERQCVKLRCRVTSSSKGEEE